MSEALVKEHPAAVVNRAADTLHEMASNETAKEVAGKYIGKYGLAYITAIVLIAVGSSYFLTEAAISAVMAVVGGALMAMIQMLAHITGATEKPDKPEFVVISALIERLNQLAAKVEPPMSVKISGDEVQVMRGEERMTVKRDPSKEP